MHVISQFMAQNHLSVCHGYAHTSVILQILSHFFLQSVENCSINWERYAAFFVVCSAVFLKKILQYLLNVVKYKV